MIINPQNGKIKKTKSVPSVPFQYRGRLQSETESSESGESSESTESIFAQFAVSYSIFAQFAQFAVSYSIFAQFAQFAVSYSIFAKFAQFAVRYFTVFDNLRSIRGNLCKKLHAQPNYALCID